MGQGLNAVRVVHLRGIDDPSRPPPLIAAALLIAIGARRGWVWTIAISGTLAMPGLDWKTATVMLAILPLYQFGLLAERWWWADRPAQPRDP